MTGPLRDRWRRSVAFVAAVPGRLRERGTWYRSTAIVLAVLALSPFALTLLEWTAHGVEAFVGDVRTWTRVAENTLGGPPLYGTTETTDIKPPGWILFAVVSESVFDASIAIVVLTAVANALAVWLAYSVGLRLTGNPRAAVVAAGLTLVAVSGLGGFGNNKTLTGVLLVAALVTSSSVRAGVLLGASLTVVQYALLGIPAVLWRWYRTDGGRGAGRVTVIAAVVCLGSYVPLLYWGWDSVVGGFVYSYGIGLAYVTGETISGAMFTGKGGILDSTREWVSFVEKSAIHVVWLGLASVAGVARWVHRSAGGGEPGSQRRTLLSSLVLLAICLLPMLFVRAYRHYWAMLVVVLGPIAAVGLDAVLTDRTTARADIGGE